MKIFLTTELKKLYTQGKSRQYDLSEEELDKFFLRIIQIDGAKDIDKLRTISQMKLEHLGGNDYRINLFKSKMRISIKKNTSQTEQYLCEIKRIEP